MLNNSTYINLLIMDYSTYPYNSMLLITKGVSTPYPFFHLLVEEYFIEPPDLYKKCCKTHHKG